MFLLVDASLMEVPDKAMMSVLLFSSRSSAGNDDYARRMTILLICCNEFKRRHPYQRFNDDLFNIVQDDELQKTSKNF